MQQLCSGCDVPVVATCSGDGQQGLLTPRCCAQGCHSMLFVLTLARYLSLSQAQAKALIVDWSDPINKPVRPSVLGTKVFMSFPIEEVLEYIDWNPFFQV